MDALTFPIHRWESIRARIAARLAAGDGAGAATVYRDEALPALFLDHMPPAMAAAAAAATGAAASDAAGGGGGGASPARPRRAAGMRAPGGASGARAAPPRTVNEEFAATHRAAFDAAFGAAGEKIAAMDARTVRRRRGDSTSGNTVCEQPARRLPLLCAAKRHTFIAPRQHQPPTLHKLAHQTWTLLLFAANNCDNQFKAIASGDLVKSARAAADRLVGPRDLSTLCPWFAAFADGERGTLACPCPRLPGRPSCYLAVALFCAFDFAALRAVFLPFVCFVRRPHWF